MTRISDSIKRVGSTTKKAEKKFRDLNDAFVQWLRNAESGSESSGSESENEEKKDNSDAAKEEGSDNEQIKPKKPVEESAAFKKQKELIDKQRKQ